MSTQDEDTLQFYAREAPTYQASGMGGVSRFLPAFLEALPREAHILELGCGGGRDAQAMIAAGHRVEPTDGVAEIAQKAEALLNTPVRVMRFEEIDANEAYDAVWANASLLHVPRVGLPSVLARVWRALKPGGLHHATYKSGGREGRDRDGRYFNYLTAAELVRVYENSATWEIISVTDYIGGGYDAGQGAWVAILLRRPL